MEFVIDKYEYKNNNKYPHIGYTKTCISTKLCLKDDIIEDLDKLEQENNKYLIQKLEGTFKTTQLNRLEELKINMDYTITHIQQIVYRGIDRYIFKIKENNNTYLSNYYLEHEFKNKSIPKEHFTIRAVKLKITPTKKKELLVVI